MWELQQLRWLSVIGIAKGRDMNEYYGVFYT